MLETEETLELRTKPKAARRAAGSREYPGGRRPDEAGLGKRDFTANPVDGAFPENKQKTVRKKQKQYLY